MPNKSKNDNYDAIGGILDFIFAEAEKPPEKRRPVKPPTEVSVSSALTDAIFASLEKPGVFISNSIVKEFNDALDTKIMQVDFFGGRGSLKLSTNNLGNWLRDPGGQVQKAMDNVKADRKAARARMLGETIDDFLTTAWAHKYGNLEAKQITLANASANEKSESYKVARAVGKSMTTAGQNDFMVNRTVDLIGQKTFGSYWYSMNEKERTEFSSKLQKGSSHKEVMEFLAKNYSATEAKNFDRVLGKSDYNKSIDIYNPELYKDLENDYLTGKIYSLQNAAPGSEEEKQRKIYEKTQMFIKLKTQKQITDLKDKLREGNLSADEKREIENAINDAEIALRSIGGRHNVVANIGKWEGYLNSLKMLGGPLGTNVVGAIITGDYFDPGKNNLTPVEKRKIVEMPGVEIYVAAKSHNKLSSAYNEMGEALYYATPRSLFRTFFYNGELFARGLYKNNEQLKNLLNTAGAGVLGDEIVKDIFSFSGKELDKQISDALEKLKMHIGSGTLSQKDFEKIQKLLERSKRFKNLTNALSIPARTKKLLEDGVKKFLDGPLRKMREGIVNTIMKNEGLKNLITKTFGEGLLKEFAKNGGLKNLIKPLVSAVAGALGIALTPLASIFITIGVNIAMDLVGKITKVFAQVMLLAIVGLIAGIVVLGGSVGSWMKWNKKTYSYNYVVPDTVNQCPAYGRMNYNISNSDGSDDWILEPGLPPYWEGASDVYEIFKRARDYVSSTYGTVKTGLILLDCNSGNDSTGMCAEIGWAWCYSASSIYCKVDKVTKTTPEYAFALFVHELLHQIQGRGCSTDLREWGADYLSSNGGAYSFSTPSGCKKATQINTSSCSKEEAVGAALCRNTNTDCFRQVSSQILDRFCE